MKLLILIAVAGITGCSSPQKLTEQEKTQKALDSLARNMVEEAERAVNHPACIDSLVRVFEAETVQNPPRKIYSYTYQGKKVYYVPALCCDFFSDLYDSNCKLIGHPDGGFTGKGDGKLPDFHSAKTEEVLVWADKRK